jgi:hypothetical protein
MALLRMVDRDDYTPEFGTLVVRDIPGDGPWDEGEDVGPLAEHATDAQPCGTIARAGYGWLEAAAGDGYHTVRLEHHDSAPLADPAGWDDMVDTPYGAIADGVGLTDVTGGSPMSADLVLSAGLYRVRVARARGENRTYSWRLQFWPAADPEPPRWLVRERPPVPAGITGWSELFGYQASELLGVVHAAGGGEGATFGQLKEWATAQRRPPDWLDQPLFPTPAEPLPTGHVDLDSAGRERRARVLADTERKLAKFAGFAAQLGVPVPSTRRGLLDLLAVAGVLVLDESGRYRRAGDPPRVWDVLDLPAQTVEWLRQYDANIRYTSFASDIASIVAWSRLSGTYGTARLTVPQLADRLLASPVDVLAALRYAESKQLLAVDGDVLTVLSKRATTSPSRGYIQTPPPGPSWNTSKRRDRNSRRARVATPASVPTRSARSERYRPPLGVPPRAGIVTARGDVVVWRDGEPVVLGQRPARATPYAALESAHGIVLMGSGDGSALLRPGGSVEPLGVEVMPAGRLSEDGRYLAVVEARHRRGQSWYALYLIDLADNSRRAMPWDQQRPIGEVIAVHGGAVHFRHGRDTTTWTPGAEPEPARPGLRSIDPLTGTSLLVEDRQGVILSAADGKRQRILIDQSVALAPGGNALYSFRYSPPAITVFELADPQEPRVFWLPNGTDVGTGQPIWEDTHTLILRVSGHSALRLGSSALRLDLNTGAFEGVPLQHGADHAALLITPLLTANNGRNHQAP